MVAEKEPKQISTGLVMKSAMLAGKMRLGLAITLHNEPMIAPTWCANCQGVIPGQIRQWATQAVCRIN
jgi:hypothetical protein